MSRKTCASFVFLYLIGSTLCVVPDGEYQIGPLFGPHVGNRLFGNNYFEAFLDKGKLKPLLVKKALLGVGAVGAAGVAALVAKKIHESKGHFGHGGQGQGGWYPEYPQAQAGAGWYPSSNDYSQGYGNGNVNFPSAGDYQYQNQYQYPAGQAYDNGYDGYTDSSYSSQGYNGWSR